MNAKKVLLKRCYVHSGADFVLLRREARGNPL
jgi:hypothetical protein